MDTNNWLPVAINLQAHRVVVLGGGRIATRKLRKVLPLAGKCIVIAPTVTEQIKAWQKAGCLVCKERGAEETDIQTGDVVICTIPSTSIRHQMKQCAARVGAWYNDAVEADEGDLQLPAVWESGQLRFAAMSGNASPRLLKLIKEDWQKRYAALGTVTTELAVLRKEVKRAISDSNERELFWQTYMPTDALTRIAMGEWEEIKGEIKDAISRFGTQS